MSMLMTTRLLQAPGPFVNCHIRCNNKRYYYPGDTISGQVIINPQETVYCHGMYVAFEGKAVVTFKTLGETRSKMEDICKLESYMMGKNIPHAGMKKVMVTPQEFNFSFELPLDLPSSFNGKLGAINFQVVVYLVRSDTYHVKQTEKTIKVRGTLDLHEHPESFKSVVYHAPSKRPPLTCTLQLNKGGFLPCEKITFTIELFNPEEHEIDGITLTFLKKVNYKVRETKASKATVAFINKPSMDEVTPTIWSGTIPVPKDLQPTQFGAPIEIIDLIYAIQIEVTDKHDSTLAKGEVPIIIGGFTKFTAPPQPDPDQDKDQDEPASCRPSRPASPTGNDEKDMDAVVSTSRRGSASDLPDLSPAFSLLSFLPLSKSISMENLKNDARAEKGKKA